MQETEGILLINKPKGKTAFSLVSSLRRALKVKKIGHAGTLDPFATGVMVMLVGRKYTRLSNRLLEQDKEYEATVYLGVATDTFDCDGKVLSESPLVPTEDEITEALLAFQGEIEQIPPMYSAKKINGKKLYELARQGKEIERAPSKKHVKTTLISYCYPELKIHVACSKGTYIRSIADDLGKILKCGAHLSELTRTKSGVFSLDKCLDGELLQTDSCEKHLMPALLSYEHLNRAAC